MRSISRTAQNILDVIDVAYSICDKEAMIAAVIERLQRVVHFTSAVFVPVDSKTHNLYFQGNVCYNCNAKELFVYITYYCVLDPLIYSNICISNVNQAFRVTDVVSASRLKETEFARDFHHLVPFFWVVGSYLGSQGDPVGCIGLHRPKQEKDFSDKDKEMVNIIYPHISKALHNIDLLDYKNNLPLEVGVIVVGEDGSAICMNEEARRMLNGAPVSVLPDPGLSPTPAYFKAGKIRYRVRTADIASGPKKIKIIFLSPQSVEQDFHGRLDVFSLTKRQKEVALLTVQGLSNREIAERLFISEQTVKDHLQDIYEKIGVNKRNKLTAKILRP